MASDVDDLFAEMGAANMQDALGETITQYVEGNSANQVSIAGAIVDLSSEGDAPVDGEQGSRVVRYGILLLPASVAVTDAERSQSRDQFMIRGKLWHCEKVVSQGQSLQTVRIKREEKASSKRTRL